VPPDSPAPDARRAPEPERLLRERFRDGDPDAIDALAVAFFDDASRFCRALLRDEDLAMEAVQETFLRALERHRLYDPGRAFRPWFLKVCRNCCLELRRRAAGRAAKVVLLEPGAAEVERLASDAPTAFETALRREREAEALRLLGLLSEGKREVVALRLFEELSFREIAEIAGRSPNTVASVYYRALEEMRALAETSESAPRRSSRDAS
jgi:RNA polymerase sigma-70 factor (ECF subfamily)